jgi:aspartyl-tRNA(Asn)/glutamyl-tRNA(Gln) amidotransferase subunit A
MSFAYMTIVELQKKLKNREISVKELLTDIYARINKYDGELGALLELFLQDSLNLESLPSGKLTGIPGVIKDNICQEGRITSCASRMLEHFKAPYDATAVTRLKKEGAFSIGRANLDEFAMGSSNETSAFKKCLNPWDHSRVAGGSSGGPIAAVAAGFVPWALGSETGGSVRLPAAYCGIVGLKPTYGCVSRYGLVAYASSLDQIGVATRTVYDNALIFSTIAGNDSNDSSTLTAPAYDYTHTLDGRMPAGLRIGIVEDMLYADGMDSEVLTALETTLKQLEQAGAQLKKIRIPKLSYSAAAYFIISRAEAASNLARFDGVRYGHRAQGVTSLADMYRKTRQEGFGSEVKKRILVGNYVLSSGKSGEFYDNAKKAQSLIRQDMLAQFKEVDLLFMPTHPAPAFKVGAFNAHPLQIDLLDYFTCSVNLAGLPALSVPCGFTQEILPIGFQLVAPHSGEELLFKVGHAYQQITDWHLRTPQGYQAA